MNRLAIRVIGALLFLAVMPAAAQADYFSRYADIPHSRTEDGAFVLGHPDAPVTIVEFADFMCPHCQDYQDVVHEFIDEFVATGLAKFEYRFFPIVHPTYSTFTSQIAECVEVQRDGAFWPSHDLLYDLAADGQIGPNTPETVADTLGVSAEKLESCLETAVQYEADTTLGESLGVSGTPAITVRLEDNTIGWAYLRDAIRNSGGLPLNFLREIVSTGDRASIVVVPRPLLLDLVSDTGCLTSCWRDIIPGETPFEGIADLLRADLQNIEINIEPAGEDGMSAVSWRTFDSVLNDSNFIVEGADGTVDVISLLDVSRYGLGEVLAVQGEPEFALAVENGEDNALFYAIYPAKALIVLAFVSLEDGLNELTTVVGAQYFSPAAMADLLGRAEVSQWVGYEGFDDYLR